MPETVEFQVERMGRPLELVHRAPLEVVHTDREEHLGPVRTVGSLDTLGETVPAQVELLVGCRTAAGRDLEDMVGSVVARRGSLGLEVVRDRTGSLGHIAREVGALGVARCTLVVDESPILIHRCRGIGTSSRSHQ